MSIKVEGVARPDGFKDFRIRFDGKEFLAERHGNRFRCGEYVGTLKMIKEKIIQNALADMPDDSGLEESSPSEGVGTFACVHPCAWMCLLPFALDRDAVRTLDCYGWLNEEGQPDVARAERELKAFGEGSSVVAAEAVS